MAKKDNIIYKITNKINGKVYIGLTTRGLRRRCGDHRSRLSIGERKQDLYLAFKKYGFHNFHFEAICCALDSEYLAGLEMDFISQYDSYNSGYNMNEGGTAISESTKKLLSAIFKGRKVTWMSKIWESRRNNPDALMPRDYVAQGSANTSSKVYLIERSDNKVQIIQGIRKFCRDNGLTHSNLFATANGGQNWHRGYRIVKTFNDYPEMEYTESDCLWKWAVPALAGSDIV